jgi:hypothetical protein
MFGYSGATVKITAKNPNVENLDFVYGMTVKTKYRVMPPDWGEDMDNDGGRLIDLRTPAPNTLPSTNPDAPYREIYADWAWQHVPGDVDIYKVIVPIPQVHPTGGEVSPIGCKYDHYDELEISAPDMEILVPAAGSSGKAKNYLKFKRLHMNFPDGIIMVYIKHPDPVKRGAYKFNARWIDEQFYSEAECNLVTSVHNALNKRLNEITMTYPKPFIDLKDPKPQPFGNIRLDELPLTQAGSSIILHNMNSNSLNLGIGITAAFPVRALLFNETGMLMGESSKPEYSIQDGNINHSNMRLQMDFLSPDTDYYLRLVPATALTEKFDQNIMGNLEIRLLER